MTENIRLIRSARKTFSIEIKRDLTVTVRVPYSAEKADIDKLISDKKEWIESHLKALSEMTAAYPPFTEEELRELTEKAKKEFPAAVKMHAEKLGIKYSKVTIRRQITRWGSCSSNGNISLNCLLMLTPEEVRDYVIIHELCHIRHMNHSSEFWALVSKYCPNYNEKREWLKKDGAVLIDRLKSSNKN